MQKFTLRGRDALETLVMIAILTALALLFIRAILTPDTICDGCPVAREKYDARR